MLSLDFLNKFEKEKKHQAYFGQRKQTEVNLTPQKKYSLALLRSFATGSSFSGWVKKL